jgi:hypothetical protein
MSTTPPDDRRTDTRSPDTHALAAELGVDARLLEAFVDEHTAPTAEIVLGWARTHGELRVHPERIRDDLAAWVKARDRRETDRLGLTEEELRETRLRPFDLKSVLGGGESE